MAHKGNIQLGRITKLHGVEGAVSVRLEEEFTEDIPRMESVFLEIEGRPVPFFVEYIEPAGKGMAHLKLQDYSTISKVKEFCGCRVFLTRHFRAAKKAGVAEDLDDYSILSEEGILIGHVTEVIKNPSQWLLKVSSTLNREILIPVHEDLIISADKKKRVIKMIIPEGLTEI